MITSIVFAIGRDTKKEKVGALIYLSTKLAVLRITACVVNFHIHALVVNFPFSYEDIENCGLVIITVLIIKISNNKASFADLVRPDKDCLYLWHGWGFIDVSDICWRTLTTKTHDL